MNGLSERFQVLLVGNYRDDQQMSMVRYYDLLLQELTVRNISVDGMEPFTVLGGLPTGPLTKWLRYFDKYVVFPFFLKRRISTLAQEAKSKNRRLIVHITDHSNAVYVNSAGAHPVVTTCHDLLAVRGAMGEDTGCPASQFGKILQNWILRSLGRSHLVICVSSATRQDLARLAPAPESIVIPLALNQPYQVLTSEVVSARLKTAAPALDQQPFILHVGSSLQRKNREGILRIFALAAKTFDGMLVFAGEALHPHQQQLAEQLGIADRVVQLTNPTSEIIEALYNRAFAFLFPSKAEGFGWPIIEAQACGCPVLVARTTSLPEVIGEGGFIRELEDEAGFASDLLALQQPALRREIVQKGHQNLTRFGTQSVMEQYLTAYRSI